MNPFDEALAFVKQDPRTGSAAGMAKLILSLYNGVHSFSFAECITSFDREHKNLAVRMVQHYVDHGEDQALLNAGLEIFQTWPILVELSNAAGQAKTEVRERWRTEGDPKYSPELRSGCF